MVDFILGESGTGKTSELIHRIAKALDSGKKCIVIVPDQVSFEYDKRLYRELGSEKYNALKVLSFNRLADEIFVKYGTDKGEYADDMTKTAIMYLAVKNLIRNGELDFFDKKTLSGKNIKEIISLINNLFWSDISAEKLMMQTDFFDGVLRSKLHDLSIVWTEYDRIMLERGLKDRLGNIEKAAISAAKNDFFSGKSVFVDGFVSFSGDEIRMLKAAMSANELHFAVTAVLDINAPVSLEIGRKTVLMLKKIAVGSGVQVSDFTLKKPLKYATSALAAVGKYDVSPAPILSENSVKSVSSRDVYAQYEYICAEICELVGNGCKYGDISVATNMINDQSGIIEAAFERYSIPYFMDFNRPVAHKSVVMFMNSTLKLCKKGAYEPEELLRYAKTGFLGVSFDAINDLENYCYTWNIEKIDIDTVFPAIDDDRIAKAAEKTKNELLLPLEKLRKGFENASGKKMCETLYGYIEQINPERFYADIETPQDAENIREQKLLWNMVISILESMYNSLGDEVISTDEFTSLFELFAATSKITMAPQLLDSVFISSPDRVRFSSPTVLFAADFNDGIIPKPVHSGGIFNPREQTELENNGLQTQFNADSLLEQERFVCYSLVTAPREKLYLCHENGDAAGKTRNPSYLLSQIERLYSDDISINADALSELFYCVDNRTTYNVYVHNFTKNDSESASIKKYLHDYTEYSGAVERLSEKSSEHKINDKKLAKKLFGENTVLSASRIDDFEHCPFIYFCKKGLKIYPRKKVRFDAMQSGTFIHFCAEKIIRTAAENGDFRSMSDEQLNACVREEVSVVSKQFCEENATQLMIDSEFAEVELAHLEEIAAESIVRMLRELKNTEFVPAEYEFDISEYPFSFGSENGIKVTLNGFVDRIDTCEIDGKTYVRIIDYKSGTKKFDLRDIFSGLNLQLLLYLFAVINENSKYGGSKFAGVLYFPAHIPKEAGGRYSTIEEAAAKADSSVKMSGIVNNDPIVMNAIDIGKKGYFIPMGNRSRMSGLIPEKSVNILRDYCINRLTDMTEKLSNGEIKAFPVILDKNTTACSYCDYKEICGVTPITPQRVPDPLKQYEFCDKVKNGGEEDGE